MTRWYPFAGKPDPDWRQMSALITCTCGHTVRLWWHAPPREGRYRCRTCGRVYRCAPVLRVEVWEQPPPPSR
jgi:hypothetical protein